MILKNIVPARVSACVAELLLCPKCGVQKVLAWPGHLSCEQDNECPLAREQEGLNIMGENPVGKMIKLTEQNYAELNNYFASFQPEISLAVLFGSYGTEQQRADSDLDFAVLFNTEVDIYYEMRLLSGLSKLLGIENVDLVNLNKASIVVQYEALAGRLIYERDPIITSDYFEKIIKYYCDYAPVLNKFDREFLEGRIEYEKY